MSRIDEVESRLGDGTDEATVEKMMGAFSIDAVNHAASMGVVLDYTEDSLQAVEDILARLEADRPKGLSKFYRKGPSEADIQTVAKLYGAYIGETIRFEWGVGEWVIPEEGPFQGALTLKYDEAMISPPAKVYKRITEGNVDNIVYYYQVFKQRFLEDRA